MYEFLAYSLVGLIFVMNIVVSVYVGKRDDLSSFQKSFQMVFIWMLPILGGMFVYSINRSHDVVIGGECGDISSDFEGISDSPMDACGGDGE